MAMNFELTISGLCVVVLKSQIPRPPKPTAVDILCVGAYYHRPLLTYHPEYFKLVKRLEPELCVDVIGTRVASIDVGDRALTLKFDTNPHSEFDLNWGDKNKKAPPTKADEKWMQWIPSVEDLGLKGVRIGKPNQIVHGVSARLSLPPGILYARNVVKDRNGVDYALWDFAGSGDQRALANEIVYRAEGVKHPQITWDDQKLEASRDADVQMCLSNDMQAVPSTYTQGVTELHHLVHMEHVADPLVNVKIPKIKAQQRTGRPICNQIYFLDKT